MQELWEKQREVEEREQRERREQERIESLKKKEKHEQSAVASSEVKQKLQVCLLLLFVFFIRRKVSFLEVKNIFIISKKRCEFFVFCKSNSRGIFN